MLSPRGFQCSIYANSIFLMQERKSFIIVASITCGKSGRIVSLVIGFKYLQCCRKMVLGDMALLD
jgi:hypothetical protein